MSIEAPKNPNFLSPVKFRFSIARLPHITYSIQSINLPSVTVEAGAGAQLSPFGILKVPGDKMQFSEVQVIFKVDEDLNNYMEVFNWLQGLAPNISFDSAKKMLNDPEKGLYSDLTLTILDSSQNPNISIKYIDAFPVYLSELTFTSMDLENEFLTAQVNFAITRWEYNKVT